MHTPWHLWYFDTCDFYCEHYGELYCGSMAVLLDLLTLIGFNNSDARRLASGEP